MKLNLKKTQIVVATVALLLPALLILEACTSASSKQNNSFGFLVDTTLTEMQKRLPENALKGLTIASGLQVKTMATEPMLINPTNIDVDDRGRVWVTEAYNYRFEINDRKARPEGDRIMILEDTNGDGEMDVSKVFYQGPEINAPLGISVLGNRVLVSQSPYVWAFYDDNGDDKADRKEIMFQGIGGDQHDHGMHSFTFGPDGKLYFNFGNSGLTLKDKNGKVVLDQDGDEIGPNKYQEGMVFRSNPDGTNVECLGHDFRNNYEAAVDSYGTIWQSDNDDDGNRGVRINYVMEYGNYGYKDEMTGAGWQAKRTNMEDSIPLRHWHLNDPGVIPNVLQTGAGSPTGLLIYEGTLLPQPFQNQMIHTDAGPNVVRSYPVKKSGAGYSAEIVDILKGTKDQWFRPADVSIAPDGSLIIADWYDPGVGGHRAGDLQRGRIYRVAPSVATYKVPKQDYTTSSGAVIALQNPNLAVRHKAWNTLHQMGAKAIPELTKLWRTSANPRMRARALWLLAKSSEGQVYIDEAIKNSNPDLRITGLRAARQSKMDIIPVIKKLINDKDPQVRRECAIALRHNKSQEAPKLWASLAMQNDGKDRWYLEALGIGADRQWDSFFAAYLNMVKDPLSTVGGRDIVWRSRTDRSLPMLASLASDQTTDLKSRLRYFRAFDFHTGAEKSKTLLKLISENSSNNTEYARLILHHLGPKEAGNSPMATKAIREVVRSLYGKQEYIDMVRQYQLKEESNKLLDLALLKANDPLGVDAARLLLEFKNASLLQDVVAGNEVAKSRAILTTLGSIGNTESTNMLESVMISDKYSSQVRSMAAEMIGKSRNGEDRALELLRNKKLTAEFIPSLIAGLKNTRRKSVYNEALTYSTEKAKSTDGKVLILPDEILALTGNAKNGAAVFKSSCYVCHQVNGQGLDFGPKLSEIGSKLPKESLIDAIIHPSAGISFGYETWQFEMKDGSTNTGIIASKTETDIEVKYPGGSIQKIKVADVKTSKSLPESMMANAGEILTKQELADVVEYLSLLKKK